MNMKCHCGYKYWYDHKNNQWVIENSEYNFEPVKISDDLSLRACPECGNVYYDTSW